MEDRFSTVLFLLVLAIVWIYVLYRWRTDISVHLDLDVERSRNRSRVQGSSGVFLTGLLRPLAKREPLLACVRRFRVRPPGDTGRTPNDAL